MSNRCILEGVRISEKVRDGYLGDLPEDIQSKIMSIHKIVKDAIDDTLKKEGYVDLKSSRWAMSCIEDFGAMPKDKSDVGSIRVHKTSKGYKTTIQVTGHFTNHEYGWIEELIHDFICDVYNTVRPAVRKKYDVTVTNEGKSGREYEGFSVSLDNKTSEQLWELFDDRKTKGITEYGCEIDLQTGEVEFVEGYIAGASDDLITYYECYADQMSYDQYFSEKSHGKLKFDYRMAVDDKTGDILKIVYSLDGIKIVDDGTDDSQYGVKKNIENEFKRKYPGTEVPLSGDAFVKFIQSDISKHGNYDHCSYNQKVLAIINNRTGDRLKEATCRGPIATKNKKLFHIRVGEIDMEPSYKSTSWPKLINSKTALPEMTTMIQHGEALGRGRGDGPLADEHYVMLAKKYSSGIRNFNVGSDRRTVEFLNKQISTKLTKKIATIKEQMAKNPALKDAWKDELQEAENDLLYVTNYRDRFKDKSLKGVPDRKTLIKQRKRVSATESVGNEMVFKESTINPSYNTDMSEAEAKRTLRTLSQTIINDFKSNKSKKVVQYTANIYANVITKNLLPTWAGSFRKFTLTLSDYPSPNTVEFKVPKMTQDFVARFIQGRENIEGFLHRQPEIKMYISPRVFNTMKEPDDAFNFFKSAIQYYDKKVGKAGSRLMAEVMRLDHSLKHLIGTTKLSGIVTYPMSLLFVFDDVNMSEKNNFELSAEDIKVVGQFVRNISSRYAAPEKEKKTIVDDVQKMVKTLRESCMLDDNITELSYLSEAINQYYSGVFNQQMEAADASWINEQVDLENMRNHPDPQVHYLQEKFGVKKLKKIPADLIAYIQIETESIKDANDKMMISSYCLSKLEIVEWYIELLNVGSNKYIVPHTKPYLESVRTQLLACFKKIMATPIPKADRPIIDIQYPKGYEG